MKVKLEMKLPYERYINVISTLESIGGIAPMSAPMGMSSMASTTSGTSIPIGFEDITFSVMGTQVTLSWFKYVQEYIPMFQNILRGLFALILARYNYRQILFLLRRANYATGSSGIKASVDSDK